MKENKFNTNLTKFTFSQCGRREFLFATLLAGSFGSSDVAAITNDSLDESDELLGGFSLADSVAIYTNLLDDVRRFVLQRDYIKIADIKGQASAKWGEMVKLADELKSITPRPDIADSAQTKKLFDLVSEVSKSREVLDLFNKMRNTEFLELGQLDTKIDGVKALMLEASRLLKENLTLDIQSQIPNLEKAKKSLDNAIKILVLLVNADDERYYDEYKKNMKILYGRDLTTPNQFIRILEIVKGNAKTVSTTTSHFINKEQTHIIPIKYTPIENSNAALAVSINSILRDKLNPGTSVQVWVARLAVAPLLAQTSRGSDERRDVVYSVLVSIPFLAFKTNAMDAAAALANV